jgi:hypothetical protein
MGYLLRIVMKVSSKFRETRRLGTMPRRAAVMYDVSAAALPVSGKV